MSPIAAQALVVLAFIPPATVLLHLGIARDERNYRRAQLARRIDEIRNRYMPRHRRQVTLRLLLDTQPFTEAMRRAAEAVRSQSAALNTLSGRLKLLEAAAQSSDLSSTTGVNR